MHFLDIFVILIYFVFILYFAFIKRKKEESSSEFITGNREVPWWAVLSSILATEISAATFLAVPGVGFKENFNYIQFGIGSLLARFFIAFVFIKVFYDSKVLTIYHLLGKKFGESSQYTASLFFVITRLLASGVRLMIATTGLAMVLNQPVEVIIIIFSLVAMIYTSIGGIKAIIYTDLIQGIVFLGGGVVALVYILGELPEGLNSVYQLAVENNKWTVFNFTSSDQSFWGYFNNPTFFLIAIINGFVTTTAALGVDQDLTQRMLTCENEQESKKSLILSGFFSIPITFLFLLIGMALFSYFHFNPSADMPGSDKVFPFFITNYLPIGLKGLLIAGLIAAAMSSLDSALGALSSTTVVDLYLPFKKEKVIDDQELVKLSKIFVFVFGVILSLIAYILKDASDLLWLCFKIGSITYGSLLGIFLMTVLTKRGSNQANILGMVISAIVTATLLILIENKMINLAWSWLIVIGTFLTFSISILGNKRKEQLG